MRQLDRDLEFESELIALEEYFWINHILAKIPPPYTEDGDLVLESVRRHFGYADTDAPEIVLSDDYTSNISRFLELQEQKKELDSRVKVLDNQMKRIKGLIASEMGQNCLASCRIDGIPYSVTFNPVLKSGISKDNLTKLKERHPDIYDEYVTVSESRRFYVKQEKEEAA